MKNAASNCETCPTYWGSEKMRRAAYLSVRFHIVTSSMPLNPYRKMHIHNPPRKCRPDSPFTSNSVHLDKSLQQSFTPLFPQLVSPSAHLRLQNWGACWCWGEPALLSDCWHQLGFTKTLIVHLEGAREERVGLHSRRESGLFPQEFRPLFEAWAEEC